MPFMYIGYEDKGKSRNSSQHFTPWLRAFNTQSYGNFSFLVLEHYSITYFKIRTKVKCIIIENNIRIAKQLFSPCSCGVSKKLQMLGRV